MRIAIVDVVGSPYDGSTPSKRALGGSESAVVYAARDLKKLGMTVHVYNDCEGLDARPGRYDGVEYRPLRETTIQSLGYDVVIGSRSVRAFTERGWMGKPFKVLWMHDTFCDGDDQVEALVTQGKIDEIWTLSDWHTTYISQCTHGHRRMMEVLKRKIWVTRNGVNLYRDVDVKNKHRKAFVFNASVSKGMETLLNDVWPKVRAQIEDAMLTIVGGAYPLKEEDEQSKKLTELRKRWDGLSGVHFTGLVSQSEVAEIVSNHGFMIYPQSFPETFGISTVESLAYGTPVISGRFGAMEETAIEDGCYLMDYPVDSNILYTFDRENHINHFVNMVVDAYNNEYLWQQKVHGALKVREVCTWDKVALQWRQHLYKKLGLYLSKNDYLEVQRINHRTHEIFNKRWSNPEEWGFYPESEKRIEVIVPFYNASQYLNTCIDSIVSQNYENFHVTLINDASTDEPLKNVNFCKFPEHKVTYITNKERVGALANQVKTIKERVVGNDTIIVLIDGDDALINDNNIFKKINQIYHDGAEMTYGSIWSMADNTPLVAQDYPKSVFEKKSFKDYRFPWNMPYTHLRTFTLGLFNRIDDKFLRDNDGEYFKAGGDSALFYSMIERCPREKCRSIKDILYLYNDKNPINDYKVNSEEQTKNANEVLSRKTSNIIDPNSSEGREIRVALEHATTNHLPPNKRVLIAIPTDRNIHPETFKSIYEQVIPEGYWTHFQHFYGYNVDQVRNLIANYAIINNFDYLFCVDYDIAFPNYTLSRFLTIDQPMVTGLYIQRKPGQHILELYRNTPHGQLNVQIEDFRDEIEKIDACGLGCCLIKTEVLKSVGYPQFVYHDAIEMSNTISEDVDFCNKVRAKGFDIWADTVVKCRHYGQTVFEVK